MREVEKDTVIETEGVEKSPNIMTEPNHRIHLMKNSLEQVGSMLFSKLVL